mgnify:CR=1 FL=1
MRKSEFCIVYLLMLAAQLLLSNYFHVTPYIFLTILRIHGERYGIASMLRIRLDRVGLNRAKIVVLDAPTSSQAETIC